MFARFAGTTACACTRLAKFGYRRRVGRAGIDETDRRILDLLVVDGRRSASEIGRLVNLSPAAAKRRIDRLEHLGIITGYSALLDHSKLGSTIEAFAELRFQGHIQVDDLEETFDDVPEVVEAFTIAGDPDALVRLRVGDLDHLKRVIDRIRRSGRVTGTKSLIVLGSRRAAPKVPPAPSATVRSVAGPAGTPRP